MNTDICASNEPIGVPLRELLDLAITRYNGFPIITRRYLWHGLENFAFDILLEKPCLIVTHHQDFKNHSKQVLSGLEALSRLSRLDWSTLGNAVQTLHKRQQVSPNHESIRIYSHSNLTKNNSESAVEATFSKMEPNIDMIDAVLSMGRQAEWSSVGKCCEVSCRMSPGQIVHLQFRYKKDALLPGFKNSLVRSGSVMLRRHISEVRDNYLC